MLSDGNVLYDCGDTDAVSHSDLRLLVNVNHGFHIMNVTSVNLNSEYLGEW